MNFFTKSKKYIIFITLLLCLITTGCNKQSNSKVVLNFSTWGSQSEIATIKQLSKEFESQNSNIKINIIHIPSNYFQKLHLLIASNLTPDVIFTNNINGYLYAKANIYENLNQYIQKDKQFSTKAFFNKALEAFNCNNELYALPRDISNLVIYYNKDIFDKYNIPYPTNNWTFKDFLRISKNLTKDINNDGKKDIFGVGFSDYHLFWTPFLWSNGGGILNKSSNKIIINSEDSINSLQFYADLRHKHHVAPLKEEAGSLKNTHLFTQQKIAMHLSGRWSVPYYRKNATFNWDVINFPKGSKNSIVDADTSGWAISKKSKHKEEAWKFVKFLTSKKSISNFTQSGLIIPARADVANSNIFLSPSLKPKNAKAFIAAIKNSTPTPVNQNYQEILDILNSALEPAWNSNKEIHETITKDVIKQLEKLL